MSALDKWYEEQARIQRENEATQREQERAMREDELLEKYKVIKLKMAIAEENLACARVELESLVKGKTKDGIDKLGDALETAMTAAREAFEMTVKLDRE